MATILKNIIAFTGLAPGVPTSLPHGLNIDDRAVLPDELSIDNGEVTIVSADATDVTVRNDGSAVASANVLAERWHSIPRAIPAGLTALTPQPFVPAGSSSGSLIASNVNVPPGTGALRVIYARPTGSDVIGNGTLANPYATLSRAVQDVPAFIPASDRYILDITGIDEDMAQFGTTLSFGGGFLLPTWEGSGEITFDFANPVDPAFFFGLPVSIQASLSDVITGLAVSGVTTDPDTSLRTINLVGTPLVPAAHEGQFVRDPTTGSILGVIASNTASDLELTGSTTITAATVDIVDTGATLRNTDPSAITVLERVGGSAQFGIFGVQIGPVANAVKVSLRVEGPQGAVFAGYNRYEGVLLNGGNQNDIGNSIADNCHVTDRASFAVPCSARNAFFDAVTSFDVSGGCYGLFLLTGVCDGGEGIKNYGGSVDDAGSIFVDGMLVRNCTRGIDIIHGQPNRVQNTKLNNNTSGGLRIMHGGFVRINSLYGSGNGGVAVKIESGAQVDMPAALGSIPITAASELQIGGLAPQTFASFYALAPPDLTDLAAANPQLCRAF